MTINKRVVLVLVIYVAGLSTCIMFLPLRKVGVWPVLAWTAICVVVGLIVAEASALSSAVNSLPVDSELGHPVPVKVRSAERRSKRR